MFAIIHKTKNGRYFVKEVTNDGIFFVNGNDFAIMVTEEEFRQNHGKLYFVKEYCGFDYCWGNYGSSMRDDIYYSEAYHSISALKKDSDGTWSKEIKRGKEKFPDTFYEEERKAETERCYYEDCWSGGFTMTIETAYIDKKVK